MLWFMVHVVSNMCASFFCGIQKIFWRMCQLFCTCSNNQWGPKDQVVWSNIVKYLFCVPQIIKKIIQVCNDIRVSKQDRILIFGWTKPSRVFQYNSVYHLNIRQSTCTTQAWWSPSRVHPVPFHPLQQSESSHRNLMSLFTKLQHVGESWNVQTWDL